MAWQSNQYSSIVGFKITRVKRDVSEVLIYGKKGNAREVLLCRAKAEDFYDTDGNYFVD